MRNLVGIPARGDDFFPRETEILRIHGRLSNGNNLQIAAPRRVGKTSILYHFADQDDLQFVFVYVDVEATESENHFFQLLYQGILKSPSLGTVYKLLKQLKDSSNLFLKRIKSINVADGTVELNESADIVYKDELSNLIKGIDIGAKKLVLLIDEFPYAINNVKKQFGDEAARQLLRSKRSLRQDLEVNKKAQFVYTGSISLNATVEQLASTELVNDLLSEVVKPLTPHEASQLIKKLSTELKLVFGDGEIGYALEKLQWLIPFHIQLLVMELAPLLPDKSIPVSTSNINEAFINIIDFRNKNYFKHYRDRLNTLFNGNTLNFVLDVLCTIADRGQLKKADLINLASKHGLNKEYRTLTESLQFDGYISHDTEKDVYYFNSTILKMWWKAHVND